MTEFKLLSHASATVSYKDTTLLMDPWLIGSCYWRSWWNYPPVASKTIDNLKVDAIYITHVHWDHWHGPSLKKLFPKDTLIITHEEPNSRSVDDLRSIGFDNIKLLKHGESFKIGQIEITPYQFGLFLNDSALVIKTPDFSMLNANDCKIAGTSLRYIINKHGEFDFALRSHSSANDRVCYTLKGKEFTMDDKDHYSRSFAMFMNAVKPKYAVPFASNHCHLHKDVLAFNSIINDPYKLDKFLNDENLMNDFDLKVMISGDSWNSKEGFKISDEGKKFYTDKEERINNYQISVKDKLEAYYKLENRLKPNNRVIKIFESQITSIPIFLKRPFKNYSYKMVLFNDKKEWFYEVSPYSGTIKEYDQDFKNGSEIRIPVKIFIDAVSMNMFHHSSISKRNSYIFDDINLLIKYEKFQRLLEYVELGVFPIKMKYIIKLIKSYRRRWREIIVYFQAFALKRKGMPIYDVEEEILKTT